MNKKQGIFGLHCTFNRFLVKYSQLGKETIVLTHYRIRKYGGTYQ